MYSNRQCHSKQSYSPLTSMDPERKVSVFRIAWLVTFIFMIYMLKCNYYILLHILFAALNFYGGMGYKISNTEVSV